MIGTKASLLIMFCESMSAGVEALNEGLTPIGSS